VKDFEFVFLLVKVPRSLKKGALLMEQFLNAIHGVLIKNSVNRVSFEVVSIDGVVSFFVVCPLFVKDVIKSQIYAQYVDCVVEEVEDWVGGVGGGGAVGFGESFVYSFKSYGDFEDGNSLGAILNSFSGVNGKVVLQIVARPVSNVVRKGFYGFASSVFYKINFLLRFSFFRFVLSFLKRKNFSEDVNRFGKLFYKVSVRVGVFLEEGGNVGLIRRKVDEVFGVLGQFAVAGENELVLRRFFYGNGVFLKRKFGHFEFFNVEEMATLFYLPDSDVVSVDLNLVGAREFRAPLNKGLRIGGGICMLLGRLGWVNLLFWLI